MGTGKTALNTFRHHLEPNCPKTLGMDLYSLIKDLNSFSAQNILYLCIGSDRVTGDCFGPLVGERLKGILPAGNIRGCLERPVHALNLNDVINEVYEPNLKPLVIAIDAGLGAKEKVGCLRVAKGALRPGLALNKTLPGIGDINILGIVNASCFCGQQALQSTRLFTVYYMAEVAAQAICTAHELWIAAKRVKCFT